VAHAERIGIPEELTLQNLGAPAELILEVLAETRARHGGAAEYLCAHGLEERDLAALRRGMIVPA
jgi:hypothetical protein